MELYQSEVRALVLLWILATAKSDGDCRRRSAGEASGFRVWG